MKDKIVVSIEKDKKKEFGKICGITPLSAYVRKMIEDEIESVNSRILVDRSVHGAAQNNQHNTCEAIRNG